MEGTKSQSQKWSNRQVRVVESKVMTEKSVQEDSGLNILSNQSGFSQKVQRKVVSGVNQHSFQNFNSKNLQSKISKMSDKIQSEISYIINTQQSKHFDQSVSERKIINYSGKPHMSRVSESIKSGKVQVSGRSPSPRIIRKTLHPSNHSNKSFTRPSQSNLNANSVIQNKSFTPILINQSGIKTTVSKQTKNSVQELKEKYNIGGFQSKRSLMMKSPVRVVQSLNRRESPFRTRKTKVIRIEHSRSVDRVSRNGTVQQDNTTEHHYPQHHLKRPIEVSNKYNVKQNVIITKPRESFRTVRVSQNKRKIQHSVENSPKPSQSRFEKSRDILAKKQKQFQRVKQETKETRMVTSRFEDEGKRKESKRGTLNAEEMDNIQANPEMLKRMLKASRDGVNMVVYNTPSFDNFKFESNFSKLSALREFNSKNKNQ
jgi:hypothetical protein